MGETRGCGQPRADRPRRAHVPDHDHQAELPRGVREGGGGETAVYMARWVNTRGEKGPWSEVTTATVAA
ncbi:MAG: hypothetical protein KGS45_10940 [Planctomycetes bacterium]|nr:hypothetical protein [Planctomycetota bacterium]